MRAILLLDETEIVRDWQRAALSEALTEGLEIVQVIKCTNTPPRHLTRRNLAYYAFVWAARRGVSAVALSSVADLIGDATPRLRFQALSEGSWQRIPPSIVRSLTDADVIIKFGMNLLRGAEELDVQFGVLSYHHGDPSAYRGRPAGFYELLHGEHTQGVVVQRLSDKLDGGGVLSTGYSQVVSHSYGQTLQGAYLAGVPLLAQALRALEASSPYASPTTLGRNYRLPSTGTVLRQTIHIGRQKVRRAAYGLFREKLWKVGFVKTTITPESHVILATSALEPVPLPQGFAFAADPFATDANADFYCELLNARTGLGEIARWRKGAWQFDIIDSRGHMSYPQVLQDGENNYLFPEISTHSSPRLFQLAKGGTAKDTGNPLSGLEGLRLVDATLFHKDATWFLFACAPDTSTSRLDLWYSNDILGPYHRHSSSPVCIDPRGARMAGPIVDIQGHLYRFGQDGSERYGASIRTHRIDRLSREFYTESVVGSIKFSDCWGPHTLNVDSTGVLVDYYTERTSVGAGLRRLRGALSIRHNRVLSLGLFAKGAVGDLDSVI